MITMPHVTEEMVDRVIEDIRVDAPDPGDGADGAEPTESEGMDR
jgi:hypothetical protein